MFNIGINQVVAVVEGNFASIQHPGPARERYIAAMQEVVDLAARLNVDVTNRDLEEYVRLGDTLDPEGMPSLRQDTAAHRPTEVEFFSGTLIEKARKVGLAVPVNESLYREIKAIEAEIERVRYDLDQAVKRMSAAVGVLKDLSRHAGFSDYRSFWL